MNKDKCIGCNNNFYNGNNPHGVKSCFSLENATIITQYVIHRDSPMNDPTNYIQVKRPNCYRRKGWIYLTKDGYLRNIR